MHHWNSCSKQVCSIKSIQYIFNSPYLLFFSSFVLLASFFCFVFRLRAIQSSKILCRCIPLNNIWKRFVINCFQVIFKTGERQSSSLRGITGNV